jgi:hypothetical protein
LSVDEFRAQFAQAAGIESEEAPVETETAAVEEATTEEQPEAEAPEDVVEEVAAEDAPEEKTLLAGKYETTEQLEKAYAEAQRKLGEQGSELGDLRSLRDEFAQLREEIVKPDAPSYDPGSIDEYLVDNPQEIPALAQQAIDAGDGHLYQRALAAWTDLDAVGAMDFHARKVSEANMAQLREEMKPALKQVEKVATANQFAAAYETASAKHDDFHQVMNAITDETIAGFPKTVLSALQTGDQASKQEVLETLYRWTKAEQAGNLTQAATAAARQTQQDSRTARTEAAVATTSTSQAREPKTGTDAFHEQFQASDAFRKAAGLA